MATKEPGTFLGGSKVQIGGPTGAFIVIIYGIIQEYGIDGLMVATMMAGVLLILLGIFKLGTVIKFIPYPIIIGFTSGIAVTIFTTQIADIFGLDFKGEKVPGDFIGKWILYFHHFDTVNWWNVIVSVVSVFIIAFSPICSSHSIQEDWAHTFKQVKNTDTQREIYFFHMLFTRLYTYYKYVNYIT